MDTEIFEIEEQIQFIMDELNSPIPTTPGLGFRMTAIIFAEAGDLTRFDFPDKLLAYTGTSPLTYSPASSRIVTHTWKSVTPDICVMPFTTQPSMSATGPQPLPLILLKIVL